MSSNNILVNVLRNQDAKPNHIDFLHRSRARDTTQASPVLASAHSPGTAGLRGRSDIRQSSEERTQYLALPIHVDTPCAPIYNYIHHTISRYTLTFIAVTY